MKFDKLNLAEFGIPTTIQKNPSIVEKGSIEEVNHKSSPNTSNCGDKIKLDSANSTILPAPEKPLKADGITKPKGELGLPVELGLLKEQSSAIDLGAGLNSCYPGNLLDESPYLREELSVLEFESPAELIACYNKDINRQLVKLHPWQLEVNEELAKAKPNQQHPHKFILCACNGSGKDAFVIAPFAIWFALTKIKSRCIITSASGVQLTSQTETYIRNLAQAVNTLHGEEYFKIRQRYIRCNLSGSEIRLFATDEEGKAEGYHPIEASSEMAIIINEGKSVAPEIYRALRRCTGYNYWIEVSTPGAPHGDFYTHFNRFNNKRHVSTFDCPHLSTEEREADKMELGEHSALYRSKHLALFTSLEGECIIPLEVVERVRDMSRKGYIKPAFTSWPIRVGLDLAAGGDETVCIACKGNRIWKYIYFREKDTTVTSARIHLWLSEELKLNYKHEFIYADDGGVGRGVIDQLNTKGWSIARVNNQSPSTNKKQFINRGAEAWFRCKRIMEENVWYFDPIQNDNFFEPSNGKGLYAQLSTRYYKQQSTQGRIALESKAEAKSEGRPSPDRADAFILSLTGLTISDFLGDDKSAINENAKRTNLLKSPQEASDWIDNKAFEEYEGKQSSLAKGKRFHFSVNSLMKRKHSNTHDAIYAQRN